MSTPVKQKNLLLIRITKDASNDMLMSLYHYVQSFNIHVTHKEVTNEEQLSKALCSGKYDYVYFAGHADENCFSDNKNFTITWAKIGELICNSNCLNNDAILMLYCCKGGMLPVVFELFSQCEKVQFICGAKQTVSSVDLTTGFTVFLYNTEYRKIDPVIAANKATDATDIRFECFDRSNIILSPAFYGRYTPMP